MAMDKPEQGEVVNHCPFGCQGVASEDAPGDLDERGYCRHLVGFTNDGKKYEPLVRNVGGQVDKCQVLGGARRCQIQPGDQLVNPTEEIINKGIRSTKRCWVSSRVYRPEPDAEKRTARKAS